MTEQNIPKRIDVGWGSQVGAIFNITSFNNYTGRYSRRQRPRTPERKIGWDVRTLLEVRLPVLALRNLSNDKDADWPLFWSKGKTLERAIALTLEQLKPWQAYRPHAPAKLINTLEKTLPSIILNFQKEMTNFEIYRISDLRFASKRDRGDVILKMSKAVGEISAYKNENNPMLGSKIMNFFFPEFFPVWDTRWVNNECLSQEVLFLPSYIPIQNNGYVDATIKYAEYSWRMIEDLFSAKSEEYKHLESEIINYSKIPIEVINYHYYDLAPIAFEICLLGKYC